MSPRNKIRRFLLKPKPVFFVANITASIVNEAIENLKKANVYASMYCKPIFMAGKEVPHRIPARIVRSIAFFLVLSKTGFRKSMPISFNSFLKGFLRLLPQTMTKKSYNKRTTRVQLGYNLVKTNMLTVFALVNENMFIPLVMKRMPKHSGFPLQASSPF